MRQLSKFNGVYWTTQKGNTFRASNKYHDILNGYLINKIFSLRSPSIKKFLHVSWYHDVFEYASCSLYFGMSVGVAVGRR